MVLRASIMSESEVSITVLCLLCSSRYTAVQIKNCLKSTSVITVKNMMVSRPSYHLKLKYPLPFSVSYVQLVTQQYRLKSTSLIICIVATTKNRDDFHYASKRSHHMQPPNQCFPLSANMTRTQRRTLVSPWRMYWMCSIPKGTSQAEAISNSEKFKPVALAVIKLC